MTQEALKMALEALELHGKQYPHMVKGYCLDAITAIKEALREHAMREVQRLGQEIEQEPVALESLLGAIARGWCHEKNANKEMDSDLAMAIATEVKTLYATPPQLEERNFCQRCGKRTKDIHTCTPPKTKPELCKYGQEPKSCTSSPMDCQCAIDAALAQPEHIPDARKMVTEQEPVASMKIYCSCCDKVQPVVIDDCRDAKTNAPFQDIVCAECRLVIASGTDISPPQRQPLTDEQIEAISAEIERSDFFDCVIPFARAIEAKLKQKNGYAEEKNT